eukprot:SAG11_NODE_2138_length_3763_cov_2.690229_3_plen_104_part_00
MRPLPSEEFRQTVCEAEDGGLQAPSHSARQCRRSRHARYAVPSAGRAKLGREAATLVAPSRPTPPRLRQMGLRPAGRITVTHYSSPHKSVKVSEWRLAHGHTS